MVPWIVLNSEFYHWQVGVSSRFWTWTCKRGDNVDQIHVSTHDFDCQVEPALYQEYQVSQPCQSTQRREYCYRTKWILPKKADYTCIHVDTRIQIRSSTPILVEVRCERFSSMVSGCIDHWEANTEFIHASLTSTLIYIQIHSSAVVSIK